MLKHLSKVPAFLIHAFTASGAIMGIVTIHYIYSNEPLLALSAMAMATIIDAADGTLARRFKVKETLPNIDGALLDNLVDFLNYVITPCLFILKGYVSLSGPLAWGVVCLISLCSSYQFTQVDAKTADNFFKGFPCYWNVVVFYLFILNASLVTSFSLLCFLCLLIFIPIKYVYPSRLTHLSHSKWVKTLMAIGVIFYGLASLLILYAYPKIPFILGFYTVAFILFYLYMSIYRTLFPL